ncbi:MAG: sigma factor-like helix-turn-helix DNA-binding protein [Eubacteriales bacterium]|nr:sigma factor-like helix-turn-helix DNA-binding protein [Eubacteriales bacterium]
MVYGIAPAPSAAQRLLHAVRCLFQHTSRPAAHDADRAAIHLYYHEGYTTAEIAAILGVKEATVRADLTRGREKPRAVRKEAYDLG